MQSYKQFGLFLVLTLKIYKLFHSALAQDSKKTVFSQLMSVDSRYSNCLTYLLTYLAVTICYWSWTQLIYDAIHHELLQLGANFGYPSLIVGEAVLFCDFHHLAQIRRLYELVWSFSYERHDPAIKNAIF